MIKIGGNPFKPAKIGVQIIGFPSDWLAAAKVNYLQAEAKILPEESWSPKKGEKILEEAKGKSLVSLS